ncbi:acetyl-CoA carboxylase biotin carboxyl carrier protein [Cupriavidus sp. IDO]|uniref:acetyl-CoA carboxylase biotin carboxyl carrier protein n=1 Tax=Cupriavidus sp. IDO TaxID=1539142 RepID=UPI00057901CF|nr:acetyl-CoA carboxylase [Cupriavidus sp. IDO]KWR88200.1 acetyl-CoA carboxylase [Cupriavidus sp. IDO]
METEHIRQLCAWLAATDIAELDLRGPGVHLCLRREGATVHESVALPTPEAVGSPASSEIVRAGSVGVFRHRHPQRSAPLAAVGSAVRESQALGLLQIGPLLLPVTAPREAVVLDIPAPDGAVVGWGTSLVELEALPD